MERLKHLYHFCSKAYSMKIHFLAFGFSFDLFLSRTCTYAMQLNYQCGCSIHDINYSYYCFSPKVIWKILLIQHGTWYFYNVHVFPFNNSILLWGIITWVLLLNFMFFQVFIKFIWKIFSPSIRP
jgi:hypothetical protein